LAQSTYWSCCGRTICNACKAETERALRITNRKRKGKKLPPMEVSCAFCRELIEENDSDTIKRYEERIHRGDLEAMVDLSWQYRNGDSGLARDDSKSLKLLQRAADSGLPEAIMKLGQCFFSGDLGVIADQEKARFYWEDAAKKGDVLSRFFLGEIEDHYQRHDLAIKHFKLAAVAGEEDAMKRLWKYFPSKLTKAELEETLRAHTDACDEMNSEDRKRLEACLEAMAGDDDMLKTLYSAYYLGALTAKELKVALKAHRSGDVGQVNAILSKCEKVITCSLDALPSLLVSLVY